MRFLLIMSLLVLLPSSSFFLPAYLSDLLLEGGYSRAQLDYAAKGELPAAWQLKLNQARYGSKAWLRLNEKLARTQGTAAVELARYYQGQGQKQQQQGGEGQEQRRLAIFWYRQGIRLSSKKARLGLAQLYFDNNQLLLAKETAGTNPDFTLLNADSAAEAHGLVKLAAQAAIALGDIDDIKRQLPLLELSTAGRALLADIHRFGVLTSQAKGNRQAAFYGMPDPHVINKPAAVSCTASIQLFATRIEHLHYLEQLIDGVESGPLAPFVCFAPVRYRALDSLACREREVTAANRRVKKRRAIKCREELWQYEAAGINSRFVGVLLPQGGANVHLGILYLDRSDNLDVFTHELSHLLGFIDEYPLPVHHNRCSAAQQSPFAHNLVVLAEFYQGERKQLRARILKQLPWAAQIREDTPILQAQANGWQLGTPDEYANRVGVFPAASCDRQTPQAFKPLSKRTQLAYYEEAFPDAYLKRLSAQPGAFLMPSFHYNIALALFHRGEIKQAKFWLNQAALWESSAVRKAKIIVGDF
ncbi:hypothetical protein [Thalassomonas haliotis]|uniref:Uncharacterized protein n=1 Tax=Thalassomonas haliotis TaxID=485448 RepID=A0ABY7VAI6_9GAMM|nr:hypothetical protein [Thalassomonas haliotis]WDE10326.1 hypothetical protein H3N35_18875 [Thalassomonas haliotis]